MLLQRMVGVALLFTVMPMSLLAKVQYSRAIGVRSGKDAVGVFNGAMSYGRRGAAIELNATPLTGSIDSAEGK